MVTSTTRREVYAYTDDLVALLATYNTVESQIVALHNQLGDKAPFDLVHAAACVQARWRYAAETYHTREAAFGSPSIGYKVVQPPTRLVTRWRRWLYERLIATGETV